MSALPLEPIDPLEDGISKVEFIDRMGDDITVVNAARVSMNKESSWVHEGYLDSAMSVPRNILSKGDARLIRFLARNNHWTPFGHVQIQLRIKAPIFVARQWFRHEVGFVRNEVSRRYVSERPEFFVPKTLRKFAANVKQGSSDETVEGYSRDHLLEQCEQTAEAYLSVIEEEGACPEQARMILPQNTYTEWIETASLAALARVFGLRADSHAQREVQAYAHAIDHLIPGDLATSWSALRGN